MVANLKFLVWKGQKRARVEDTLFGMGEREGERERERGGGTVPI